MNTGLPGLLFTGINIQNIPTPELWISGTIGGGGGPGAVPGLKESQEPWDYILTSEDAQRIIPSQDP